MIVRGMFSRAFSAVTVVADWPAKPRTMRVSSARPMAAG